VGHIACMAVGRRELDTGHIAAAESLAACTCLGSVYLLEGALVVEEALGSALVA
jgi:hypothetical protein